MSQLSLAVYVYYYSVYIYSAPVTMKRSNSTSMLTDIISINKDRVPKRRNSISSGMKGRRILSTSNSSLPCSAADYGSSSPFWLSPVKHYHQVHYTVLIYNMHVHVPVYIYAYMYTCTCMYVIRCIATLCFFTPFLLSY